MRTAKNPSKMFFVGPCGQLKNWLKNFLVAPCGQPKIVHFFGVGPCGQLKDVQKCLKCTSAGPGRKKNGY